MTPSKERRIGLTVAAGLFVIAMIWLALLERSSYTRALCQRLRGFGYSLSPSDFYTQGYGTDTSIEAVLQGELTAEEIENVRGLSKSRDFPADTEKIGTVELMLCELGGDKVMVVYLTDKVPQLAFIECVGTGEVLAIGE